MIGADALLEALKNEWVTQIFGYPGGAVLPLYDRLPCHDIAHILVRHEQGAGFAAAGYARVTGNVWVCLATSWPWATNLVTAIADAKLDSIPLVAITGNVFKHLIGSDAFQEVDTVGIVEPIVKHAFFVGNADDIENVVYEAFHLARSGRPGPVLIDITKNAQADTLISPFQGKISLQKKSENSPSFIPEIDKARQAIEWSKKPIIIYGHGVTLGNAHRELEDFLEKSGIPAVWTFLGIGGVDETKPRRYGMLGMHGTMASNFAVHNADCIIGIGIRFDDRIYGKLTEFQKDKHIVHFDIDPSEFGKNVKNYASIMGDVRDTLPCMTDALWVTEDMRSEWNQWNEKIAAIAEEHPLETNQEECSMGWQKKPFTQISVIDMLYEIKHDQDIVVVDVGQHQMWSAQRFLSKYPRTFHGSGGLGTMWFSLPTAIGATYGTDRTVWSISWDGGIQMNIQELGTIMAENIPVKIIILNNSFLGMVRQWQELFYGHNYVDTPMKNPDFAKIAEAYGIKWMTARSHAEGREALNYMKNYAGPILCNFIVENESNVYPMVPAGQSLGATIWGKA